MGSPGGNQKQSHAMVLVFLILGFASLTRLVECGILRAPSVNKVDYHGMNCRKHTAVLTDFGGVGDGKTSNTKAFRSAIAKLRGLAVDGGALLIVPPGKWLTGSFNLTSHFTLYIHKDAVILASQEDGSAAEWPIISPLPSYGRGRDNSAGRFSSLISGTNLTDVVITGGNGTINGQGEHWWGKFKKKQLKSTRPYLIEIMHSKQVQISDLTLINSPSWNVHPVYCRDVIIQRITIIAPTNSPNTDGINPDSCINTKIEDCKVTSGDDCIAVKSGWDQYGIKFGMPTQNLIIRRFTCISPDSAVIALGSEMSGGIQNVRAEDITAINSQSVIRIKTAIGRGAYIKDIFVRRMTLRTILRYVFWISGNYGSHPDDKFDPKAITVINNINYKDVSGENVTMVGRLEGYKGHPFTGICLSNATFKLVNDPKTLQWKWNCTDIQGISSKVSPPACKLLANKAQPCAFPEDKLPIDKVQLKKCSASGKF